MAATIAPRVPLVGVRVVRVGRVGGSTKRARLQRHAFLQPAGHIRRSTARPAARPAAHTHARTQARKHARTQRQTQRQTQTHMVKVNGSYRGHFLRAPQQRGGNRENKLRASEASAVPAELTGVAMALRFYVTDEPKLTSAGDRLCQVSPKLAFAALIAEIEGSRRIRRHRRLTMFIKAPRQQRSLNSRRNGPYDMPSSSSLPCDPSLDGREELTLCPVSHRVTSHHVGGAGRLTSLPAPCLTATACWLRDCES